MSREQWTTAEMDKLATGWRQGLTARQIAEVIGKSRNAVLGKLFRAGLLKRKFPGQRLGHSRQSYEQSTKSARTGAIYGKPSDKPKPARPTFVKTPIPRQDPEPDTVISHAELEPHHCRWIFGDVGSSKWGYCGQTREVGAYCQEHQRKAYTSVYVPSRAIQNAECNWKIAKAKKETVE